MSESRDPHFDEEALQRATDTETARYGTKRFEEEAPLHETDLGGNPGRQIPPSLPGGKDRSWYAEGGRMLVDESAARRKIRETEARNILREQQGLPPIEINPDKI